MLPSQTLALLTLHSELSAHGDEMQKSRNGVMRRSPVDVTRIGLPKLGEITVRRAYRSMIQKPIVNGFVVCSNARQPSSHKTIALAGPLHRRAVTLYVDPR